MRNDDVIIRIKWITEGLVGATEKLILSKLQRGGARALVDSKTFLIKRAAFENSAFGDLSSTSRYDYALARNSFVGISNFLGAFTRINRTVR